MGEWKETKIWINGERFSVRWRATDNIAPKLRLPRKFRAWVEEPHIVEIYRSYNIFRPFIEFYNSNPIIVQAELQLDCDDDWFGVENRQTGFAPVVLAF